MSVLTAVYADHDFSGNGRAYKLNNDWRYDRIWWDVLVDAGLILELPDTNYFSEVQKLISSAVVFPSSSSNSLLFLFSGSHFTGDYVLLRNVKDSEQIVSSANLSAQSFDNKAGSLLLVNTAWEPELRFSVRNLIQAQIVNMIDSNLAGTPVSRVGQPEITWDVWPENQDYLDSDKKYIKLRQRLHISIDWWPDYEAEATYHIYLYLDGSNHLQGYVARWWLWVEDGIKADDIWDQLAPAVEAGMAQIETQLDAVLAFAAGQTFRHLYYLPGNQSGGDTLGVTTGNTKDDVTLVLELQ